MATLEELPPDRRAIIELVLRRGQSYEDLADALGMPEARVRRHAREALASLTPDTADRVESEWRGQVADYLLRQQEGPQAKATRAHIRRSEPARAWALSTVDSLGDLYPEGKTPAIPGADGGSRSAAAEGDTADADRGARPERSSRPQRRADRSERRATDRPGRREADERPRRRERTAETATASAPLSPEARAAVRRRRIVGGALGGLVAVAAVVGILLLTGVLGGGEEPGEAAAGGAEDTEALSQQPPELLGQVQLQPVGGGNGAGVASIGTQQGQPFVVVQAKLEPTQRNEVYVVWAYNDPQDAVPIGAIQTDEQGNLQGAGPLPEDYERYSSIDVSLQEGDGSAEHSGNSVLRGSIEDLQPPPE